MGTTMAFALKQMKKNVREVSDPMSSRCDPYNIQTNVTLHCIHLTSFLSINFLFEKLIILIIIHLTFSSQLIILFEKRFIL